MDRHVCTGLADHYGFTPMGATHFMGWIGVENSRGLGWGGFNNN
jgi:hypothetical protein